MRRILSWAAAAAIFAIAGRRLVPAGQLRQPELRRRRPTPDEFDARRSRLPRSRTLWRTRRARRARRRRMRQSRPKVFNNDNLPDVGRDFDRGSGNGTQGWRRKRRGCGRCN